MINRLPDPSWQLQSASPRQLGSWRRGTTRCSSVPASVLPQVGVAQLPAAEAVTETSESNLAAGRLEAILFLAREPLSSRKLSQYANLADGTQARTLIRRLN